MEQFKLAKLFDAGGDLSKQWYVFYSYQHPETKKYVRFKKALSLRILTRTDRHKRASEVIRDINTRLRKGWNPFLFENHQQTSLIDAIKKVVEVKSNNLRARTRSSYSSKADIFIEWLKINKLENIPVSYFSYHQATEFLDWTKTERKIANRTYNNYLQTMTTFFNFLIAREYVDINPFKRCEKLTKTDTEIVTFTRSELDILRTHLPIDNLRLWACAQLVFYCFIRPAEIMRLKAKDIDLDRQIIYVHGYLSKNRKDQLVVIPDPLVETLKKLEIDKLPENYHIFASKLHPAIKAAASTRMAEIWREWADRYGISKQLYHLKHTGAGMALDAGMNVRDLQLQLRHNSLEMTQVYLDRFRKEPGDRMRTHFPSI